MHIIHRLYNCLHIFSVEIFEKDGNDNYPLRDQHLHMVMTKVGIYYYYFSQYSRDFALEIV